MECTAPYLNGRYVRFESSNRNDANGGQCMNLGVIFLYIIHSFTFVLVGSDLKIMIYFSKWSNHIYHWPRISSSSRLYGSAFQWSHWHTLTNCSCNVHSINLQLNCKITTSFVIFLWRKVIIDSTERVMSQITNHFHAILVFLHLNHSYKDMISYW